MVEHMSAAAAAAQSSDGLGSSGPPRFSLFGWLRRRNSTVDRPKLFRRKKRRPSVSSCSSSDTSYSTATVKSFAYHSGLSRDAVRAALRFEQSSCAVGPFAPGAVKLLQHRVDTLPTRRQDIQTRYLLQPFNNSYISFDNIPFIDARTLPRKNVTVVVDVDPLTSDSSASVTRKVHVKGKRRAPDPPVISVHVGEKCKSARGGRRKRRPAPKPPGYSDTLSSEASTGMEPLLTPREVISNDTLVLRRGVLLSKKDVRSSPRTSIYSSDEDTIVSNQTDTACTDKVGTIMPRPWYKRSHEHSSNSASLRRNGGGDIMRGLPSPLPVDETVSSPTVSLSFPFEGSLSRLSFFNRGDRLEDKKKENKRRSGVSILTNISELDKEAAAIVQEEQARNRASMILQAAKLDEEFERRMGANKEIVEEIVNASMGNPPRRSTRALISKFNAIGNITKVTVNSNFFTRNNSSSPKPKNKRFSSQEGGVQHDNFLDRDLSKYFGSPKRESTSVFTEVARPPKVEITTISISPPRIDEKIKNAEFVNTLAAELDDVATDIAKLRQELDQRPKMIVGNSSGRKEDKVVDRKLSAARNQELANFDKEFTKIFSEIDRQLRTRPNESKSDEAGVSRVLDILVGADKNASVPVVKNHSINKEESPVESKRVPKIIEIPVERKKETTKKNPSPRRDKERIGDGKACLKEMLKEMKYSLPKSDKRSSKQVVNEEAPKKVSSGVQTSGNIRRVMVARSPVDVKTPPRENAYANVMERSTLNAGKREKIDLPGEDVAASRWERDPVRRNDRRDEEEKLEEAKKQYMNTMAVNRLLRKLEAAIASGNHQQAAILARELAQLKIHCSVVRQRSSDGAKEKVNLKMYIEDKQAHQGPIPLQLPVNMTVAQLKAKIHIEFEIPANVQRWIIGKNLADNDESTLEELQALEGSPIFLYLVGTPDAKEANKTDDGNEKIVEEKPKQEEATKQLLHENNDEKIHDTKAEIESAGPELEAKSELAAEAKADEPQAREVKEGSLSKEEKLQRYEELMSLENCDVIANTEPIECPVCFVFTIEGEGVILRDCLHSFCRSCVANVVRYCDEAEVKCPYRDANYTCDSTLQEREIKALVPAEVYQQHLDKSIAQAENNAGNNAFHCKTPDCPGWCIYDDNVNNFLCPVCKVNNCLTCQAIHMGKNCRQYQEELKYSKDTDHESKRTAAMLEEMVDRGEALPCPTCAVVLMKKWGCDWLRCSMCKTEICWVTRGPRWGPGGKGDTSGGCKCGENGVKCHPKCNYCH